MKSSNPGTVADSILETLTEALAGHDEIAVAYLFGSAARDESGPGSDLDLAIVLTTEVPEPLRYRARLMEELARASSTAVDVVFLSDAPPELAGRVVREGKLLLSHDESARVRFETEALRRYFDTARLRRELDRGLVSDLRHGRFLG